MESDLKPGADGAGAASLNTDWQRRSRQAVWHPCTQMARLDAVPPLPIARGQGPWLFDMDGRRYFDALSSWWVNLFGHDDAGLRAAVQQQLQTLPHVMLAGCTHAPAVQLAERLSARTGGALGHAFYASDGASAVEIALKMSFHHWRNLGQPGKRSFACLRGGYHGETLGALHVTDVEVFRDAYDPLLLRAHRLMSPDARQAQAGESAADVARRALAELAALLAAQADTLAALVIEPLVQGAAGMAMHHPLYLREALALCRAHRVHLIADEIAVGCGRTGRFFAFEHAQRPDDPAPLWPDFICLSKGISGGLLPLSLVLSTDAVFQAFWSADEVARGFLHSHSYTGNALACAAALAVLDRFEHTPLLADNARRARWLGQALAQALAPWIADGRLHQVRQQGLIWAADVRPEAAGARFAERLHLAARAQQLLLRPIGHTVYLMPPYVLTEADCHWLAQALARALAATLEPCHDADRTAEPPLA